MLKRYEMQKMTLNKEKKIRKKEKKTMPSSKGSYTFANFF